MTAQTPQNQLQPTQTAPSDKEINFRKQEAMYQRMLAEKDAKLKEMEHQAQKQAHHDDEDDDSEPYVDKKKLNKVLNKFGEQSKQHTQTEIKQAVQQALGEERKANWLKNNPDFYEVLQHAEKFAQKYPELAETILEMPEGFERQKLVYKNTKALGLDKPEEKKSTIQDKIDANRKGPFYHPSGQGSAPYASAGDYSESGQKNAYAKMQELKNRLRI